MVIIDYFCYVFIHSTLVITQIELLTRKLAWTPSIVLERACVHRNVIWHFEKKQKLFPFFAVKFFYISAI